MLVLIRRASFIFALILSVNIVLLWQARQAKPDDVILFSTLSNGSYVVYMDESSSPFVKQITSESKATIAPNGRDFAFASGTRIYNARIDMPEKTECLSTCDQWQYGSDIWGLSWSADSYWLSYYSSGVMGFRDLSLLGSDGRTIFFDFSTLNKGYIIPQNFPQWQLNSKTLYISVEFLSPDITYAILEVNIQTGGITTVLTGTSGTILDMSLSHDGQWLAYIIEDKTMTSINIISAKSNAHPIVVLENLPRPASGLNWSPDDLRLTYYDFEWDVGGSPSNLYVTTVAGEARLIGNTSIAETKPVWSPDGKWIAFVAENEIGTDLYRMRPDGSSRERLTTLGTVDNYNVAPQWFMYPDYPLRYNYLLSVIGLMLGVSFAHVLFRK